MAKFNQHETTFLKLCVLSWDVLQYRRTKLGAALDAWRQAELTSVDFVRQRQVIDNYSMAYGIGHDRCGLIRHELEVQFKIPPW